MSGARSLEGKLVERVHQLDASDGKSLWQLVAQSLDLRSGQARVVRSWQLDSNRFEALCSRQDLGAFLVPINAWLATSGLSEVKVRSIWRTRVTEPVDDAVSAAVQRSHDTASDPARCVLLRADETRSFPVVEISTEAPAVAEVGRKFRLRQFLPVARFKVAFDGVRLTELRVSLPVDVSVHVAAITCRFDFEFAVVELESQVAATIRGASDEALLLEAEVNGYVRGSMESSAANLIKNNVGILVDALRGQIIEAAKVANAGFRSVGCLKAKVAPNEWTAELDGLVEEFDRIRKLLAAVPSGSLAAARDVADQLQVLLRASRPLIVLPAKYEPSTGVLVPPELGNDYAGARKHLVVAEVAIPFTTEREPSTQGKRSALILLVLAMLLAIVAAFDRSWIPHLPWLRRLATEDLDPMTHRSLLDPMVGLLVLFPAILYGQFFQTRPRSQVGYQAQLGLFGLLSVMFALPLVPASLLVTDVDTQLISILLLALAVTTFIAGVLILRVFRSDNLRRLRETQAYRAATEVLR